MFSLVLFVFLHPLLFVVTAIINTIISICRCSSKRGSHNSNCSISSGNNNSSSSDSNSSNSGSSNCGSSISSNNNYLSKCHNCMCLVL